MSRPSRLRTSTLLLALLALAAAACAPRAVIPDAERERVRRQLTGDARWLRVAAYAAPLWGDTSKVLLSDQPLDELDLVESAGGTPIAPPAAEKILPPGTAVRITDVEFPTGWVIAKRVVMSPRYHPWVLVEVPGDTRPYVVVLSQTAASFGEVRGELDRILTKDDPSSALAALPDEQRAAVLRKTLVDGMGPRAVEMAWGLPEVERIDRPAATAEWTWPGGKRRAFFQDDRLVRWEKP
ncbi:MAG TPA: hypothetical protein VF841_11635 [Anaeromyxobacter sp.]